MDTEWTKVASLLLVIVRNKVHGNQCTELCVAVTHVIYTSACCCY